MFDYATESNELTYKIIGAAIEVHKHLGPGLMESTYEHCLAEELRERNLRFERQLILPIDYKGKRIESAYRVDFLVEDSVIIELKSVEKLLPVHEAQLFTYLKLSGKKIGLIINFNVKVLNEGIERRVM